MRDIDKIIIHCTDTRENTEVSVADIRKWHVDENGWSDIGYHYIVHLNGDLSLGRPIEVIGAHVEGHNTNSIGVVYAGGRSRGDYIPKDTRTHEQKVTLYFLLMMLNRLFPKATLHGHREFSAKACPSFDVSVEYEGLIKYFNSRKK